MPLDLAPETESILEREAAREGVSVDTLIRQTFPSHPKVPTNRLSQNKQSVPDDDPVLQFLNARIQEAVSATPEENAVADAEYKKWQQNMNETR